MYSKVFISYAREDISEALHLYQDLTNAGIKAWIDTEKLLPGQNWKREIEKIISESDFFISVFSDNSVTKRGYAQKEIKIALEILDQIPENDIFFIPVKIEECDIDIYQLSSVHFIELFQDWNKGVSKIISAIKYHVDKEIYSVKNRLLKKIKTENLDSQLEYAIGERDIIAVQSLIDMGADVNYPEEGYGSFLRYALCEQDYDDEKQIYKIVELLINAGANVNEIDEHGHTLLWEVAFLDRYELSNLLIESGININFKSKSGETVIMHASSFKATKVIKLLIQNGAEVNDEDNNGNSVLHHSIYNQCYFDTQEEEEQSIIKTLSILTQFGADINKDKASLIDLANYFGYRDVSDYIKNANKAN